MGGVVDRRIDTLELRTTQGEARRIPLRAQMVIGRAPEVDVVLDAPGVSRRHAMLTRDADAWILRDLDSRNGTYVNGAAATQTTLRHGDVITIADFTLTLLLDATRGAAAFASPSASPVSTHDASSMLRQDALAVSSLREMASPKVDTRHLFALQKLGRELLETPDPADRLALLSRMMIGDAMQGRHAAVVRVGRSGDDPPQFVCGPVAPDRGGHTPFYLSQTVLRAVRDRGESVLASNAATGDAALELSIATPDAPMSVVACPLQQHETSLDLLYVIMPATFGTAEWLALAALATEQHQQAEQAWSSRRQAEQAAALQRDLERARQVQMGLLPRNLAVPGLDVAMHFQPCRGVGGDYLDIVSMRDGRVLLVVADVCGKGMQAALVAASLHTFIHAAAATDQALPDTVTRLNGYLRGTLPEGSFVTMLALAVDPADGAMQIVAAGHPPVIVADPHGHVRLIEAAENLPLGIDDAPFDAGVDHLGPSEVLAIYSDGLTEVVTAERRWLGHDGLAQCLARLSATPTVGSCPDLLAELMGALAALNTAEAPEDDQAILLARRASTG